MADFGYAAHHPVLRVKRSTGRYCDQAIQSSAPDDASDKEISNAIPCKIVIKNRVFSVRFFLSRGKSERARLAKLKSSGRVNIGRFSYGDPHIEVFQGDNSRVSIGSFCSIASEVTILVSGNHRSDWVSTFPFRIVLGMPGAFHDGHPASKGDVIIGSDVWIGRGATILSGSTIGHGAVVGAEAVWQGTSDLIRRSSLATLHPKYGADSQMRL